MNFRLKKLFTAEVAQLAEHLVVAQVAEGSSPFFRPRFTPNIVRGFLFFPFFHTFTQKLLVFIPRANQGKVLWGNGRSRKRYLQSKRPK